MSTQRISECPNGKTYGAKIKQHLFRAVKRERLPEGHPRGDYRVVEVCKFCGHELVYCCIYA